MVRIVVNDLGVVMIRGVNAPSKTANSREWIASFDELVSRSRSSKTRHISRGKNQYRKEFHND